jgi:phosphopentomutase
VPLLISGKPVRPGVNLGVRDTFADLAATIADVMEVKRPSSGTSFKEQIIIANNH